MTVEERDINLEDLFRNKLEGSEIVPEGDLTTKFLRRLGRKEFLRFNPGRFNIYYAAAGAAAVATIAGLLLFAPGEKNIPENIQNDATNGVEQSIQYENAAENTGHETATPPAAINNLKPGGAENMPPKSVTDTKAERQTAIAGTENEGATPVIITGKPTSNAITVSNSGMPRPVIDASITSGCVPLQVKFSNATSGSFKTEWSFGDGGVSDDINADYIYDLPGNYTVTLTLTDNRGRKAVTSVKIEAWSKPKAAFEIPETDVALTDGQINFTNLSTGATQYLWNFGDGISSGVFAPSHKYEHYGRYDVTLIAFSEYGCEDSVTIADAFTDTGVFLRFPNAFMPNPGGPTGGYYSQRSDETNQVFHPVSSGVTQYNLKIYSKQGLLVFESDDINLGWDGYYKGQLSSPGVFIWKVRGAYRNGQPFVMSGDVTLLSY